MTDVVSIKDLAPELVQMVLDYIYTIKIKKINYKLLDISDYVIAKVKAEVKTSTVQFDFTVSYEMNNKQMIDNINKYLYDNAQLTSFLPYIAIDSKNNKIKLENVIVTYSILREAFRDYLKKILIIIDRPPDNKYVEELKAKLHENKKIISPYLNYILTNFLSANYYGMEKLNIKEVDDIILKLRKIFDSLPNTALTIYQIEPLFKKENIIYFTIKDHTWDYGKLTAINIIKPNFDDKIVFPIP